MGVKQNTVFCFFLPLLSFENLTSPIIFLKKKRLPKKKKSPNLKNVCNWHLDKTIEGIAQEIVKLEFLCY